MGIGNIGLSGFVLGGAKRTPTYLGYRYQLNEVTRWTGNCFFRIWVPLS